MTAPSQRIGDAMGTNFPWAVSTFNSGPLSSKAPVQNDRLRAGFFRFVRSLKNFHKNKLTSYHNADNLRASSHPGSIE